MKNVFKRCLKLLALLSSNSDNVSTEYIKDNITEYRNLGQSAFKRSFERDKSLLKDMGFLLDFENNKWKLDEGYKISGTRIFENIRKDKSIDIEKFMNTYRVVKQFFKFDYELDRRNVNISKITQAISDKRRISFKYKGTLRKVYPLGLKQYDNQWYVGANDNSKFKTFKLDNIDELKLGSISDLHNIELDEINFSWEKSVKPITITLFITKENYLVQKNNFKHIIVKITEKNKNVEIVLTTFDFQKLIIFILLTNAEIKKITSSDKKKLLQVLND